MGSKGGSDTTASFPAVQQQEAPEIDPMMFLGPMQAMMEQNLGFQQNLIDQQRMEMEMMQAPDPTDVTTLDWDKENKALQDKIDSQVAEEDLKRKGVLGTILTSIEDEDAPQVVGSLLTGENKK